MADRTLGEWLGQQVALRGWSLAELARRMDVWASVVSRWSRDEVVPSPAHCLAMAEALDVDPDLVLSLAGHRTRIPGSHSALQGEAASYLRRIPDDLLPLAIPILAALADETQQAGHRERLHAALASPLLQPVEVATPRQTVTPRIRKPAGSRL